MTSWKRFVLIGVVGVTLALTSLSSTGEATWLRNWLARRYAPVQTTYYAPVQTTYYRGGGLFRGGLLSRFHRRQPTTVQYVTPYVAPAACGQTCQTTCQRTVVQYVPQTAYRTVWNRVPVTVYRPVTSVDPCTSCQTVCYRPCTTYSYQAQQVPYTTYRPVTRTISYQVPASCPQPVAAPSAYCATPGVTAAPNAGCGTCNSTSPGWVPAPSQGASSMLVPSQPGTPSFAPNPGPAGGPSFPNQPIPADPADETPRLQPGELYPGQQLQQGSGQRSSFNTASPFQAQPSVSIPALRPLPNLDENTYDSAPPLIPSGQRTASNPAIRLVGAVSEIDWPQTRSDDSQRAIQAKATSETQWDDGGWRSAGRN